MSYNKTKEEKKWVQWKKAEEKLLRTQGVSEDVIEQLRTYDWQVFKSERRYLEKLVLWNLSVDWRRVEVLELPVTNVESFLNSIENMQLFDLLSKEDKITLQILFYKLMGYTSKEISKLLGMKKTAIDKRFLRLKRNYQNFYFNVYFDPLPTAI